MENMSQVWGINKRPSKGDERKAFKSARLKGEAKKLSVQAIRSQEDIESIVIDLLKAVAKRWA